MDMFGKGVEFFFKGQNEFKTGWGCFVTTIIVMFYILILAFKMTEFFGETDPV